MQPKFNPDFTKLCFFGSQQKFISHSGNYQLRQYDWPLDNKPAQVLVDLVPEIQNEDFAGIYGYNDTFFHAGFLNKKFFVFTSGYKGQDRIYIVDTETKEMSYLRLKDQEKTLGEYQLIRKHKSMLIVKYSEATQPTQVFAVRFNQMSGDVKNLTSFDNLNVTLLEANKFDDSQLSTELTECLSKVKGEVISLENGADASFQYPTHCEGKRPMIVMIHGGPFGASPYHMYLAGR